MKCSWIHTGLEFLDGEFSSLAMSAYGLVNSSICSTADETDDLVAVNNSDLALVSHIRA
jgi:hypothetical protein